MFDGFGTAIVGLLGAAVGWLGKRWLTKQPEHEEAAGLLQIVELELKLKEAGLTLEQVQMARDNIKRGTFPVTTAVIDALSEPTKQTEDTEEEEAMLEDGVDFSFGETTAGIRLGLGHRLDELENRMEFTVNELRHITSESRAAAVVEAQEAWQRFAKLEGIAAGLQYEGGTLSPVVTLGVRVDLAERRLADLESELLDEKKLRGIT